jgi:hypothetical protein
MPGIVHDAIISFYTTAAFGAIGLFCALRFSEKPHYTVPRYEEYLHFRKSGMGFEEIILN